MKKDVVKIGLKAEIENIEEIEQQIKELQDKLSNMGIVFKVLNSDSKNLEEPIEADRAIYDIEDLIPEAEELYSLYKTPPIGEDVDDIIIQVIDDLKEMLKQGVKESTTIIKRLLNESEKNYIRDTFIAKGYRYPSFSTSTFTRNGNTAGNTRIKIHVVMESVIPR